MKDFVQLIAFNIGDEELAVNINDVQEIIRIVNITRVPNSPHYISGVINLRGMVIPVMDLAKRYNLQAREYGDAARIIILNFHASFLGLLVSSVSEVVRLPNQNVESADSFSTNLSLDDIDSVGTINKRVMAIINIKKLFETN